jgi:hypothetical protein
MADDEKVEVLANTEIEKLTMHQPAPTFGALILIGQRFFDTLF